MYRILPLLLVAGCTGGVIDDDLDGYSAAIDCNDEDAAIHPGAPETCNGIDDDCDGAVDDDFIDGVVVWTDADGDGYGDPASEAYVCSAGDDHVDVGGDCDDADAAINPDVTEVCDAADVDEDCDGLADDADADVDSATASTWYDDLDGDGYGDASDPGTLACDQPDLTAPDASDCDDSDAAVHPGATEVCNGVDDDCDPSTDESGMVAFQDDTGAWTDLTAEWAVGDSTTPATIVLADDGLVEVCDGTFYVAIEVLAQDLEIHGVGGAESTFLDGADLNTVITMTTGNSVTLADLTVQNGRGSTHLWDRGGTGGGVACAYDSELTIDSVVFDGNVASNAGGAIMGYKGCLLDLTDSLFQHNHSTRGGAIVGVEEVPITATGTDFIDNTANVVAGAVQVVASFSEYPFGASFDDCYFTGNSAQFGAGAIWAQGFVNLRCTGTSTATAGFHNNRAHGSSPSYGAVMLSSSTTISATLVSDTCDWGNEGTDDDNDLADVSSLLGDYDFDDDASFTCNSGGCK